MTPENKLMALADDYASSHNAHTIYRLKETRAALLAAVQDVCRENERLREALESIATLDVNATHNRGKSIARAALKGTT